MREKVTKSDFINKLHTEIEHREMIAKAYKTAFQEVLNSFDGKVYNKRFINALNDKLQAINPLLSAREERGTHRNSYSNYPNLFCVEVVITCRFDKFNYSEKEYLYTNIIVVPETYRIDMEKSKTEKYAISWYNNFCKTTEEKKQVIKNYSKYAKVAQKVADAINVYKELPADFRRNIEFSNKFYLDS